jgi:voltage-gated potassium channel
MTTALSANDDARCRPTAVAAGMFYLSLLFLVLLAGLLYSHEAHNIPDHADDAEAPGSSLANWDALELRIQRYGLATIWPVFVLEALWTFWTRPRGAGFWKPAGWVALVSLIPPLRIAGRITERDIWLPRLGWRPVDRDLRRRLERFFGVPMIVIALMVLPLLAIEYGWRKQVEAYPGLRLFLEIANSAIWLAFAVEFLVMISVADKKLRYCALHWVDIAIILLPVLYLALVQWAPLLRSLRVLRLSQLSRMGRVYRMQGLALKAWRAFLVLEVIQRVLGRSLEKQLKQLEELLIAKEEEVRELRREIEHLKKRLAEENQSDGVPKPASTPAPPVSPEIDIRTPTA